MPWLSVILSDRSAAEEVERSGRGPCSNPQIPRLGFASLGMTQRESLSYAQLVRIQTTTVKKTKDAT